jgi:hypothetical protein
MGTSKNRPTIVCQGLNTVKNYEAIRVFCRPLSAVLGFRTPYSTAVPEA